MSRLLSRSLLLLPALLAAAPSSVPAQTPAPTRAVPVEEDPPVPRAIPVAPPGAPAMPATPAATPGAPKAVPVPDDAPPKPKGPDEDLFDYATLLYERKEYNLAVKSLGEYLNNYSSGRHVPLALFRMGECFFALKQMKAAETYYVEVVTRYPSSEGAPSAAYRLGALKFQAQRYDLAARYFAQAESSTTMPQVRLAAAFNKARSFQLLGDTKSQAAALAAVIAVKTDNPYRVEALLARGTLLLAQDAKAESLSLFLEVLKEAKDPAALSDASVKAAVLYAETGKPEEAIPLFEKALLMPETTPVNRSIALVGVVQALFAKGDYDAVVENYNRNATVLPPGDVRPKLLLLVGNAHRMKKSYARAVEIYLMVEQDYRGSEQAFEAGYWKLYCFYLLNDRQLGDFANAFLAQHSAKYPQHEYINLARLIRADFFFNKPDYAQAATAFAEVQIDQLPEKLRPGTLFNRGWAQAEAGRNPEAVQTFSIFLDAYKGHEFTAKALTRRGLARMAAGDPRRALTDFQRVVKEHPNSEAAEIAYLQIGNLAMKQDDAQGTITAFEALVQRFPSSPAAAQAWYGIGRAYSRLSKVEKAVPALQKAVERDPKTYQDTASQMIINGWYLQQNVDELAKAIDAYRRINANAIIAPNVLTWLGLKLYEQKQYARCTQYLSLASTPDAPQNTEPAVWSYLGRAFLETKDYKTSIKATDNYLATLQPGAERARALVMKGRALMGLNEFQHADQVAREGLEFAKDGKPQALLLILEGDILAAEGVKFAAEGKDAAAKEKFAAAAAKYMNPAQFFEDEEITPEALDKAATALEKAGQTAKAETLRGQLKSRYPRYQRGA